MRYLFSRYEDESQIEDDTGKENVSIHDLLSGDLDFLLPLLRKFPKCYWIWKYRIWLLDEATRLFRKAEARSLWQQELGLVGKMLTLDNRNFHGWGYRRKIVTALESTQLPLDKKPSSMTEEEFQYTTKMIESNLSNFSAWHTRSKLIPRLLDERKADTGARISMLDNGALFVLVFERLLTVSQNWSLFSGLYTPIRATSPSGSITKT